MGYIAEELGLYEMLSLPKKILIKEHQKINFKTLGERLRLILEELGPTFIKMGQIASTRPDIIPKDIIHEFEKLQDNVPAFSIQEVKAIIEQEVGEIDNIFIEFSEVPIAAASIGQVHYAVLKSGQPVAVKVQRPNIENIIKTDLEILKEIALLAESRLDWASRYKILDIIEEFSNALLAELDYSNEGRNAEKISKQFNNKKNIRIPTIYWEYSTKKVLMMEFIKGTKINEIEEIQQKGYNTKILAERIAQAIFHQILIEGFYHGDPHPGNIAVLPDEIIVFMDFGMIGRLNPEMKTHFASLVISMMRQNTDGVIKAITRMGLVPDEVNMQLLRTDIDFIKDKYYDVSLSQVSLGEAINELFSIANQHHIRIPSDLTLLAKTLLTIEGVVVKLDPDISIINIAEPFGRQLLKDRYHPRKMAESIFNKWEEYGEIFTELPKHIQEISSIMKSGKLPIEINIPKVELLLTKLDRISNRLSFSIVLLSFSIIMVGLIIGSALGGQSSLLWNIPAIEIGFGVAIFMFLWLLYSIFKSGRF